ncbi:MAG: hypothetical protein ABR522_11175 [Marinobacter sp.]
MAYAVAVIGSGMAGLAAAYWARRAGHDALDRWHRQPGRKVFFCGSWAYEGVPVLESAVRSANAIVNSIGR